MSFHYWIENSVLTVTLKVMLAVKQNLLLQFNFTAKPVSDSTHLFVRFCFCCLVTTFRSLNEIFQTITVEKNRLCSYSGGSVRVVAEYKDARFVLSGRAPLPYCIPKTYVFFLRGFRAAGCKKITSPAARRKRVALEAFVQM